MKIVTLKGANWLFEVARTRILNYSTKCLPFLLRSFSSSSSQRRQLPTVTLYTKDNCPLCDYARSALLPYAHRIRLEEVDVTLPENSDWFDEYRYDIPVLHLNGDFLVWHRVNTDLLERKLASLDTAAARDK